MAVVAFIMSWHEERDGHGEAGERGLWVPKTCVTWPDAPLTAGWSVPRLPGRGMIFGLWA